MHALFKSAVTTAKSMDKKGTSMWEDLANYSLSIEGDEANLDKQFKAEERLSIVEVKYEMDKNSTYRAIKSVLKKARRLDVKLVDENGKVRGKTDVEKECKALEDGDKSDKPAIDKFKAVMNTANTLADKLEAKDAVMAAALVQDLLAKLVTMVKPTEVEAPRTGTEG